MNDVSTAPPGSPPAQRAGRGGGLERLTVNLVPRSSAALDTASSLTGDSKTDTINRAVQVYAYLVGQETAAAEVFIREPDGGLSRLLIML